MIELNYGQNADYLIPDMGIDETPVPLGKYARMRQRFLQEHKPGLFSQMLLSGTLKSHLLETEETANRQLEQTMTELTAKNGATEKLKAEDQMAWVGLMNSLKAQAEEMILAELIYA